MTSSLLPHARVVGGGEGGQVPVEGVTGNEGPKSLLDVCHDLVECTNAADWPHEYGVAQNAGGQHRRRESEKSAWVRWVVAVVAAKERKCGKRGKERRSDGWGGRREPKMGEGLKRSGLKLKTSKKGVGGKEGEKGVRVDGRELGGRGEKRIGRVRLVKEAATPFLAGGSRWGPI